MFIYCNKCTTLVGNIDNRVGNIGEISVPSFQFCCDPKKLLKIIFRASLVEQWLRARLPM